MWGMKRLQCCVCIRDITVTDRLRALVRADCGSIIADFERLATFSVE